MQIERSLYRRPKIKLKFIIPFLLTSLVVLDFDKHKSYFQTSVSIHLDSVNFFLLPYPNDFNHNFISFVTFLSYYRLI